MAKIKFENGVTVNFNGTPTEQDIEEIAQKLNLHKVAKDKNFLQKVGDVFTGSTQKFGETIGSTAALGGQQKMLEEESGQNFEQQQKLIKAISDNKKIGKDTSNLERTYKDLTGTLPSIEELNPTINTTTGQLAGQALGTVVEATGIGTLKGVKGVGLATELAKTAKQAEAAKLAYKALPLAGKLGTIAKTAGKEALSLAPIGYGADVSNKLQEGKTGTEAFTPGLGTALSIGIPAALGVKKGIGAITKTAMQEGAPGVINSLVKPLLKDFSYGKNPGRAVAELGITANSLDELGQKISIARKTIGQEIGSLSDEFTNASTKVGKKSVPLTVSVKNNLIKTIDDAMDVAAKNNDSAVLSRLEDTKRALTENLSLSSSVKPEELVKNGMAKTLKEAKQILGSQKIISTGPVKLDKITYNEALQLKQKVGDITKWTGNASDDKTVNKTLKKIYGTLKEAMDNAASKAGPEKASKLRKLNQQYADLMSAEIATKYRDKIAERQNLVGITSHLGAGIGAITTAIATGGASVPVLLAGLGGAALDKALGSTAFKTRLAAWMAKESPGVIEQVFIKNPALRTAVQKMFTKENMVVDKTVKDLGKAGLKSAKEFAENPTVGLSIKNVSNRPKQFSNIGKIVEGEGGIVKKEFLPEYSYHFTKEANLNSIKNKGLLPSKDGMDPGLYLSTKPVGKIKTDEVWIRTPSKSLKNDLRIDTNLFPDENGQGDFITQSKINAKNLEYSKDGGKTWKKLTSETTSKSPIPNSTQLPKKALPIADSMIERIMNDEVSKNWAFEIEDDLKSIGIKNAGVIDDVQRYILGALKEMGYKID